MKHLLISLAGVVVLAGCASHANESNGPGTKAPGPTPSSEGAPPTAKPAPQAFEYMSNGKTYVFASAESLNTYLQTQQPPKTETIYHNGHPVEVEAVGGDSDGVYKAYAKNHK